MIICKFCGTEQADNRFRAQHERFCKQNPEPSKPSSGMLGKKGANAWTRNPEYQISDATREKLRGASAGRTHTDETKKRISDIRKEFIRLNPDKTPYRMNHKSKGQSHPEKYWQTVLENHGQVFSVEHRLGMYSLDFAFPELKVDLEIDGRQHFDDPKVVTHDKARNENLIQFGWRVVRVVWYKYIKMSRPDKEVFVQTILNQIHNGTEPLFISPEPEYTHKVDNSAGHKTCVLKEKQVTHTRPPKFQVTPEEMTVLVNSMPLAKIGEHFGVSHSSIQKRCKKLGVPIKPQGYWNKPENRKLMGH